MSKSSTDGFSAKEKKTFQDMLVNKFFTTNIFLLQSLYDEKKFKLSLKNAEIMLERYPNHPGKYFVEA